MLALAYFKRLIAMPRLRAILRIVQSTWLRCRVTLMLYSFACPWRVGHSRNHHSAVISGSQSGMTIKVLEAGLAIHHGLRRLGRLSNLIGGNHAAS